MEWPEKIVFGLFAMVSTWLVFIGSLGNPEFGGIGWIGAWLSIEARIFAVVFLPVWILLRVLAALARR